MGAWKEVEQMNECSTLSAATLKANPAIRTFDQTFKRARRCRAPARPVGVPPPASS